MAKTRSINFRVAALQVNAGEDWRKNFSRLQKLVSKAHRYKPHLIALPENFLWRGAGRDVPRIIAESSAFVVRFFSEMAAERKVSFLLGSILEKSSQVKKCYNTSILIDPNGRLAAKYRKIHLFDVKLKTFQVRESKSVLPGNKAVSANLPGCRVGLSICYDLRFPELYRKLVPESEVLFIPANFTKKTGQVHWEVLLKARAIENLSYVVAPAQVGTHPSTGIESYGHSLIIDPWGKVLAEAKGGREEVISAELDLKYLHGLRENFPVLTHRRIG